MAAEARTYAPDQLEDMRAHLAHARRRPSCHGATGPRCECECGGHWHQGGPALGGPIPEEILTEADAIARSKHRAPAVPGPRRIKRNAAQLKMLLA